MREKKNDSGSNADYEEIFLKAISYIKEISYFESNTFSRLFLVSLKNHPPPTGMV